MWTTEDKPTPGDERIIAPSKKAMVPAQTALPAKSTRDGPQSTPIAWRRRRVRYADAIIDQTIVIQFGDDRRCSNGPTPAPATRRYRRPAVRRCGDP